MATIGERLRDIRLDRARWAGDCPTLEEVADAIGAMGHPADAPKVSRWERGDTTIPAQVLPLWLDVLRCTPGERAALMTPEPSVSDR